MMCTEWTVFGYKLFSFNQSESGISDTRVRMSMSFSFKRRRPMISNSSPKISGDFLMVIQLKVIQTKLSCYSLKNDLHDFDLSLPLPPAYAQWGMGRERDGFSTCLH